MTTFREIISIIGQKKNNEDVLLSIDDGEYKFELKCDGLYAVWQFINNIVPNLFSIEINTKTRRSNHNSWIGILWGGKDLRNFYYFGISLNSYYTIQKMKDGYYYPYTDWKRTNHINQGNFDNQLTIIREEENLEFFINRTCVEKLLWTDTFFSNNIGMIFGNKAKGSILDLTVKSIDREREKYLES